VGTRRRPLTRRLGERRYKKLYLIATEGSKTEPAYFAFFTGDASVVHVKTLKGRTRSAPVQVLHRMRDYLQREGLKPSDEAWLVVDQDRWQDSELTRLHQWSLQATNRGFALSNPKFEYWLLLHFEDGSGIASSMDCTNRLKRYLPDYDKGIDTRKIALAQIEQAIRRAQQRDHPRFIDWPRTMGATTVYRLVERILGLSNDRVR
jgi:RloB-like protein